jgi:hypothetical protein
MKVYLIMNRFGDIFEIHASRESAEKTINELLKMPNNMGARCVEEEVIDRSGE